MKFFRKLCIYLICAMLFLSEGIRTNASAELYINDNLDSSPFYEQAESPLSENYELIPFVQWRKNKPISMSYILEFIHEPRNEHRYTVRVESTLDIECTLNEQQEYTYPADQKKTLDFEIRLLELPQKLWIDFDRKEVVESDDALPAMETISVIVSQDGEDIIVRNIYVFLCQYGLFICDYAGPDLYLFLAKWKKEHDTQIWIIAVILFILTAFTIGYVIWRMRRNKIKKRIEAIQAASAFPADSPPPEAQHPDAAEDGSRNN